MKQIGIKELTELVLEIGRSQRGDYTEENQVLGLCCKAPNAEPRVIAEEYTRRYGKYHGEIMTGGKVIHVFHICHMTNITDRIEKIKKASYMAEELRCGLLGKNNFEFIPSVARTIDRIDESGGGLHYKKLKRFTMLCFAESEMCRRNKQLHDEIFRLDRNFAAQCYDAIIELIHSAYEETNGMNALEQENRVLRNKLGRANELVNSLQESFDEQLTECRLDEQARVISMLNSEKYGHILDLLTATQGSFRKMREQKKQIPMELRNVQTLVRRLMEFVEDCDVTSTLQIGDRMTLTADELDKIEYVGSPFMSTTDSKEVEVISPGWEIKSRSMVISYPRVREIEREPEAQTEA